MSNRKQPGKTQPFLVGVTVGLMLGLIVLDLVYPVGSVPSVLYISLVMLALASKKAGLPFFAAMTLAGLVSYDLVTEYSRPDAIPWTVLARSSLVFMGLLIPVGVWVASRKVDEHNELMDTPLNMCPSCKKIRDDQGAWNKIEDHLREETGRETATAFCPDCRKRWTGGQSY